MLIELTVSVKSVVKTYFYKNVFWKRSSTLNFLIHNNNIILYIRCSYLMNGNILTYLVFKANQGRLGSNITS